MDKEFEDKIHTEQYEHFVVDEEKQSFKYPTFGEKDKEFDIDKLWADKEVTKVVKIMLKDFIHLFVQLTPLQQQIVCILIVEPDIKFNKLCHKLDNKSSSWVHRNLLKINKYTEFSCLMPNNVGTRLVDN